MDSHPHRQGRLRVAAAKQRLREEPPLLDTAMGPCVDWIRRHPKEAVVVAALAGVVLGKAPGLRKTLLTVGLGVARKFIR